MDEATARQKYASHKAGAKTRGIEFDLTFDEWRSIWGQHLANRGVHRDQMQMCRLRDEGGYRSGNVRIDTQQANAAEAKVTRRRKDIIRDWVVDGRDESSQRDWIVAKSRGISRNPIHLLMEREREIEEDD